MQVWGVRKHLVLTTFTFIVGAISGVAMLFIVLIASAWVPSPLPLAALPFLWLFARWFGRGMRWFPIGVSLVAAFLGGAGATWWLDGTASRDGANANELLETIIGFVLAAVVGLMVERTTRPKRTHLSDPERAETA